MFFFCLKNALRTERHSQSMRFSNLFSRDGRVACGGDEDGGV